MNRTPYLRFKSERLERQWRGEPEGCPKLHPSLRVLTVAAGRWHWLECRKPALVTGLARTAVEQAALYPGTRTPRSPHEQGRAADLSVRMLTPERAAAWAEWLNAAFPYRGGSRYRTALVHAVGAGAIHLHLQIAPGERFPAAEDDQPSTVTA